MFAKIVYYYKRLSGLDFTRKILFSFLSRSGKLSFGRKVKALFFFKTIDLEIGKHVRIHGLPYRIKVGSKASFYDHCIFEFGESCNVEIGANVVFSYGVIFSCRKHISIGNDVQVGEYSSIRDSTHRYDEGDKAMKYAIDHTSPVIIGNDVWIGRGCLILPGAVIEEGVVVAAHSVVKGKLERNGIYGGKPAKFIKSRFDG